MILDLNCSEEGLDISLPKPGHYATGLFFIQNDEQQVCFN